MRRILSFLLAAVLLLSLVGCGEDKETDPVVEEKNSIAEVNTALGFDLLEPDSEAIELTYRSAAVIDGAIAQAEYQSGSSTVELRMTLDSELAQGLAGYKNAGKAGGVEAPAEVFSTLEIYVISDSLYYCEFSYTNSGYTCYLSLAETKTDFTSYSNLLIDYVNQLYNLKEIPNFIYAIDPEFVPEPEEPEPAPTSETGAAKGGNAETGDPTPAEAPAEPAATDTIVLEYYDITLVNPGDTYTFSPSGGDGTYTWTSANREVAIVSPNSGTVTAVANGTTTITCTSGDGLSADVIVRVGTNQ